LKKILPYECVLTEREAEAFGEELTHHPELKEDFEFFDTAWKKMDAFQIGDPSDELRTKFYDKLNKELTTDEKSVKKTLARVFEHMIRPAFLIRSSFGLLLLAVGFILGGEFARPATNMNQAANQEDVLGRSNLSDYIPATSRLEEVFSAAQKTGGDNTVNLLLQTLSSDPNINVRVVALEELNEYAHDPKVRQQLVKLIKQETSPLVQMELVNTILDNSQTKEKIRTIEKLLATQKDMNPIIKQKMETDLPILRASM